MLKVGCQWGWITGGTAAGLTAADRPAAVAALPGRHGAGGGPTKGLPAKGGTGYGRHGAREPGKGACRRSQAARADGGRTGQRAGIACPRRGGTGRTEEREGRAAQGRHGAKGGACAVPLHGEALGKRKAPHGAGLVRADGRGFMPAAAAAG
jgi:hypothetical protein